MLISCICVTEGRPQFIKRAVTLFKAQSHPEKEMLILDSFHNPSVAVPSALPPEIVYLRCPDYTQGRRLGLGMAMASGTLLSKWDDDDVYGVNYLSESLKAHNENSITCLRKCLTATVDGEVRVRGGRFCGGTIMLSKEAFHALGGVSDIKKGVDSDLFLRCTREGIVYNPRTEYFDQYTYVRHGNNTWNGMQSVIREGGIEHVTYDEHWKSLPVYNGEKRAEVLEWLQR